MKIIGQRGRAERGTILLVIVFIATAIAGLAAITSGRVVSETKRFKIMEEETLAFNQAYAQIHMAMNVVNNSAYDAENHNLAIRASMEGTYGGTAAAPDGTVQEALGGRVEAGGVTTGYVAKNDPTKWAGSLDNKSTGESWLKDPTGVVHGLIEGTTVRVYRGRDYIRRLQKLKGETVSTVDPGGLSDSYFVLEAAGRAGDTVRLMSALVRENEPFSSFVFFQNKGTLGVSGNPRGLIHSNSALDFYFSGGEYVDSVSAVSGFGYQAGATTENTSIREGNPSAAPIELEAVDFDELKAKADIFTGDDGLDAQITLNSDATVRVKQYTPPRFDEVERFYTWNEYVGYHMETRQEMQSVQVGEQEVSYTEDVVVGTETVTWTEMQQVQVGTTTETYTETVTVQTGTTTETRYRSVQVQTGTQEVEHSRQEPIYDTRMVTRTRWVQVWVPYNDEANGGTAVGGGGAGELGEYQWVQEEYQEEETYISGYETITWFETEPVYETVQEPYDVTVPVYEDQIVERTREIPIYDWQEVVLTREDPIYETVTLTRMEPVYEDQLVDVEVRVNDYEERTVTWTEEVFVAPVLQSTDTVSLSSDYGGTMYVDGRITRLQGALNGRLTIVGNETVKITGNIQYVDDSGRTAMLNGTDYTRTYDRNPDYDGQSVLGVIARDDVIFNRRMPSSSEVNGTLMAVNGRVGIDGFWSLPDGELIKDSSSSRAEYLSAEKQQKERAYDWAGGVYPTRRFTKDSMRRIGGIVSNTRILETYIRSRTDGTSYVDAGFKRGNMKFDINLLFNPPPNFVEVPRPVLTYFMPVILVRNNDA